MKIQPYPATTMAVLCATFLLAWTGTAQKVAPKPTLEKTQGQVRVVLLRVANFTSSNHEPAFEVTYGIEVPQKGAFSDLSIRSDDAVALTEKGQPVLTPGAVSSGSMGMDKLPRQDQLVLPTVAKGKAMLGEQVEFEGLKITTKMIDVTIRFSWRGQAMTFAFKDVPVR
jgi:hypothetical protein